MVKFFSVLDFVFVIFLVVLDVAAATNNLPLGMLWNSSSSLNGWGSPSVKDDVVYTMHSDGRIFCFGITNGTVFCNVTIEQDATVRVAPVISEHQEVYVGTVSGRLYYLPGSTLFSTNDFTTNNWLYYDVGGAIQGSPTVVDGIAYVGCANNKLVALRFTPKTNYVGYGDSVALVWEKVLGNAVSATPFVWTFTDEGDGLVFASCENKYIYALSAKDGSDVWSYPTSARLITSPIVRGRAVYVVATDGSVYAFNAVDGTLLWTTTVGWPVASTKFTVVNGTLYVGTTNKELVAIAALDGTIKWRYLTGQSVQSMPTVVNGFVYVGSGDTKIHKVNAISGVGVTTYTTGGAVIRSPTIKNGILFVPSNDRKFYALVVDSTGGSPEASVRTTSRVTWSHLDTPNFLSSILSNGTLYATTYSITNDASTDCTVMAMDVVTGFVRWKVVLGTGGAAVAPPLVAEGLLFIGSSEYTLYALHASNGTEKWNYFLSYLPSSMQPVYDNGKIYISVANFQVYVFTSSGFHVQLPTLNSFVVFPAVNNSVLWMGYNGEDVVAVNMTTLTVWKQHTTGGYVYMQPTIKNGVVYVGADDGKVYAFDETTGELKWTCQTYGKIGARAVVANNIVYVASNDYKLNAIKASSGNLLWQYETGKLGTEAQVDSNGVVYVATSSAKGGIHAINGMNGALIWNYKNPEESAMFNAFVAEGVVYGHTTTKIYLLGAEINATLKWNYTIAGSEEQITWYTASGGVLYIAANSMSSEAFSLYTMYIKDFEAVSNIELSNETITLLTGCTDASCTQDCISSVLTDATYVQHTKCATIRYSGTLQGCSSGTPSVTFAAVCDARCRGGGNGYYQGFCNEQAGTYAHKSECTSATCGNCLLAFNLSWEDVPACSDVLNDNSVYARLLQFPACFEYENGDGESVGGGFCYDATGSGGYTMTTYHGPRSSNSTRNGTLTPTKTLTEPCTVLQPTDPVGLSNMESVPYEYMSTTQQILHFDNVTGSSSTKGYQYLCTVPIVVGNEVICEFSAAITQPEMIGQSVLIVVYLPDSFYYATLEIVLVGINASSAYPCHGQVEKSRVPGNGTSYGSCPYYTLMSCFRGELDPTMERFRVIFRPPMGATVLYHNQSALGGFIPGCQAKADMFTLPVESEMNSSSSSSSSMQWTWVSNHMYVLPSWASNVTILTSNVTNLAECLQAGSGIALASNFVALVYEDSTGSCLVYDNIQTVGSGGAAVLHVDISIAQNSSNQQVFIPTEVLQQLNLCQDVVSCSGRGIVSSGNSNGACTCVCSVGYAGTTCEESKNLDREIEQDFICTVSNTSVLRDFLQNAHLLNTFFPNSTERMYHNFSISRFRDGTLTMEFTDVDSTIAETVLEISQSAFSSSALSCSLRVSNAVEMTSKHTLEATLTSQQLPQWIAPLVIKADAKNNLEPGYNYTAAGAVVQLCISVWGIESFDDATLSNNSASAEKWQTQCCLQQSRSNRVCAASFLEALAFEDSARPVNADYLTGCGTQRYTVNISVMFLAPTSSSVISDTMALLTAEEKKIQQNSTVTHPFINSKVVNCFVLGGVMVVLFILFLIFGEKNKIRVFEILTFEIIFLVAAGVFYLDSKRVGYEATHTMFISGYATSQCDDSATVAEAYPIQLLEIGANGLCKRVISKGGSFRYTFATVTCTVNLNRAGIVLYPSLYECMLDKKAEQNYPLSSCVSASSIPNLDVNFAFMKIECDAMVLNTAPIREAPFCLDTCSRERYQKPLQNRFDPQVAVNVQIASSHDSDKNSQQRRRQTNTTPALASHMKPLSSFNARGVARQTGIAFLDEEAPTMALSCRWAPAVASGGQEWVVMPYGNRTLDDISTACSFGAMYNTHVSSVYDKLSVADRYYGVQGTHFDMGQLKGDHSVSFWMRASSNASSVTRGIIAALTDAVEDTHNIKEPLLNKILYVAENGPLSAPLNWTVYWAIYVNSHSKVLSVLFSTSTGILEEVPVETSILKPEVTLFDGEWHFVVLVFGRKNRRSYFRFMVDAVSDQNEVGWYRCFPTEETIQPVKSLPDHVWVSSTATARQQGLLFVGLLNGGVSRFEVNPFAYKLHEVSNLLQQGTDQSNNIEVTMKFYGGVIGCSVCFILFVWSITKMFRELAEDEEGEEVEKDTAGRSALQAAITRKAGTTVVLLLAFNSQRMALYSDFEWPEGFGSVMSGFSWVFAFSLPFQNMPYYVVPLLLYSTGLLVSYSLISNFVSDLARFNKLRKIIRSERTEEKIGSQKVTITSNVTVRFPNFLTKILLARTDAERQQILEETAQQASKKKGYFSSDKGSSLQTLTSNKDEFLDALHKISAPIVSMKDKDNMAIVNGLAHVDLPNYQELQDAIKLFAEDRVKAGDDRHFHPTACEMQSRITKPVASTDLLIQLFFKRWKEALQAVEITYTESHSHCPEHKLRLIRNIEGYHQLKDYHCAHQRDWLWKVMHGVTKCDDETIFICPEVGCPTCLCGKCIRLTFFQKMRCRLDTIIFDLRQRDILSFLGTALMTIAQLLFAPIIIASVEIIRCDVQVECFIPFCSQGDHVHWYWGSFAVACIMITVLFFGMVFVPTYVLLQRKMVVVKIKEEAAQFAKEKQQKEEEENEAKEKEGGEATALDMGMEGKQDDEQNHHQDDDGLRGGEEAAPIASLDDDVMMEEIPPQAEEKGDEKKEDDDEDENGENDESLEDVDWAHLRAYGIMNLMQWNMTDLAWCDILVRDKTILRSQYDAYHAKHMAFYPITYVFTALSIVCLAASEPDSALQFITLATVVAIQLLLFLYVSPMMSPWLGILQEAGLILELLLLSTLLLYRSLTAGRIGKNTAPTFRVGMSPSHPDFIFSVILMSALLIYVILVTYIVMRFIIIPICCGEEEDAEKKNDEEDENEEGEESEEESQEDEEERGGEMAETEDCSGETRKKKKGKKKRKKKATSESEEAGEVAKKYKVGGEEREEGSTPRLQQSKGGFDTPVPLQPDDGSPQAGSPKTEKIWYEDFDFDLSVPFVPEKVEDVQEVKSKWYTTADGKRVKRKTSEAVMKKRKVLRQKIRRFYKKYDPAMLPNISVGGMIRQYNGREDELMSVLVRKYGPEPPPPGKGEEEDDASEGSLESDEDEEVAEEELYESQQRNRSGGASKIIMAEGLKKVVTHMAKKVQKQNEWIAAHDPGHILSTSQQSDTNKGSEEKQEKEGEGPVPVPVGGDVQAMNIMMQREAILNAAQKRNNAKVNGEQNWAWKQKQYSMQEQKEKQAEIRRLQEEQQGGNATSETAAPTKFFRRNLDL